MIPKQNLEPSKKQEKGSSFGFSILFLIVHAECAHTRSIIYGKRGKNQQPLKRRNQKNCSHTGGKKGRIIVEIPAPRRNRMGIGPGREHNRLRKQQVIVFHVWLFTSFLFYLKGKGVYDRVGNKCILNLHRQSVRRLTGTMESEMDIQIMP